MICNSHLSIKFASEIVKDNSVTAISFIHERVVRQSNDRKQTASKKTPRKVLK